MRGRQDCSGIGSWTFLTVQSIAVVLWILANVWLLSRLPFDAYPFVLLDLMFSVQAAYTGPVLLLAGNRQAQKDRLDLEILTEIKRNTDITLRILEHLDGPAAKA